MANLMTKQIPHRAATIIVEFADPITGIGFDLIGVLEPDDGSLLRIFNGDDLAGTIHLDEFIDGAADFYDPSIEFGPNSANRIHLITNDKLKIDAFDRVEFVLIGPYAVDNLMYERQQDYSYLAIHTAVAPDRVADDFGGEGLRSPVPLPQVAASDIVVLNSIGFPDAVDGSELLELTPESQNPDALQSLAPAPPLAPTNEQGAAAAEGTDEEVFVIPTPGAATAGFLLLVGLSLRRRRRF